MASMKLARPEAPIPDKNGNINSIYMAIFQDGISSYIKRQDIIDYRMQNAYSFIVVQFKEGFRVNINGIL